MPVRETAVAAAVLATITTLFHEVASGPSCQDRDYLSACSEDCDKYKFYTCVNFNKVGDFYHYVQRALKYPNLWFILEDSQLDYYPGGTFADGDVSGIELRNARAHSFAQFETGPNPFLGIEDSLQFIVFRDGSTLPDSWTMLGRLKKLEKLEFWNMKHLELTRDFNDLPQSMTHVYIHNSTIGYIDENWLSSLKNLERVIVQKCNLKKFLRSMLPLPAPKLHYLELESNALTFLPRDIGQGFPRLYFFNVGENNITTLSEESLAPLKSVAYVDLYDNPLHCDCRLRFLLEYSDNWSYSHCASPAAVKGSYLKRLSAEQMTCGNDSKVIS
ncbi:protein slit-like [Ixodes scapularis]|uniref:protein slit-like n=1 Tax=Ixodes scapularis TaxID=6945 RepID=UPI001C390838|nr:protein slit-like [Ixodes scapularis]